MKKFNVSKRIMAIALSFIMIVGLMPMTALASDAFPGKPDGMTISGSSTETINGQTVWLCPNSGGSIVKKNTGNGYAIYEAAPYGGYTFSHWATYCVAADWLDTFESANRYDEEEGYAFSKSDSTTTRYNEKDSQIRVNTSSEANYTYYVYAVFVQGVSVSISVEGGGANIYAKNLDNYISSASEYEYYVKNAEGTVHFGVGVNSRMEVQILSDWATYFEHVYVNDVDVINTSNVYYYESGPDRKHYYVQEFTVTEPITIRAVTKQRGVNVTFYSNDVNATGTMEKQFLQCYEYYNISENQFINEGYIFSGWNTKADGTGTSYTDKQPVRFTIADDGTELTLYAQWAACTSHQWEDGACTECGTVCSHSGGNATCTEQATCSVCGMKYGDFGKHKHVYTASENIITETCENNCGHNKTATITAPTGSLVYDGTEKKATVSYSDGWKGGDLTVTYSDGGNINAGNVTASIEKDGVKASVDYTIDKINPNYTIPTGLTATYGQTLANIALPEGWTWDDPTASVGDTGTNSFKAIFTPADTRNYNTVNADVDVTVDKAVITITADNKTAKQYEELPQFTFTVTGLIQGDTLITNPTISTQADMKSAGTFEIIATGADAGDNYTITYVPGTLTVEAHTEHSGGTATSTEKAICSVCGAAYGELVAQTGDNSNILGSLALMFGSMAAMFAIIFGTKKKRKQKISK